MDYNYQRIAALYKLIDNCLWVGKHGSEYLYQIRYKLQAIEEMERLEKTFGIKHHKAELLEHKETLELVYDTLTAKRDAEFDALFEERENA